MSIIVFSHPDCLAHETPEGHPERPDRLRAVEAALSTPNFAMIQRAQAEPAEDRHILRAHPQAHLDRMTQLGAQGGLAHVDADTVMTPGGLRAAKLAAGAAAQAVDAVLGGEAAGAFCATRPPGHHAESARAMGFCFFNNAAIAALHAIEAHGLSRVAIVDFDVHHGNGVQDIFERDGRVMYVSTHQWPLYPGTGAEHERGAGNIMNRHLPPQADGEAFRALYTRQILPALDAFRPELLIICAGFDGHRRDPLGSLRLEDEDYAWVTAELLKICKPHSGGRVVSLLEGGYDLEGLARGCAAHVQVLSEQAG